MAEKYRILIYSGNADACVPTPGSEQWTSGLGFNEIDAWRPWTGPINGADQAGGFATTYQPNNFSFVTLTLSGHMAPQFVPEAASIMLDRFLNDKAY
jgi:carboxypeptidase C (cathepsin A)